MTPPPRRVLFLHSSDELYGSDRVLLDLVTHIDRTRFEPIVVLPLDVPGGGALSSRLAAAGISTVRRPLAVVRRRYFTPLGVIGYAWRLARDVFAVRRLARQRHVDVVYSNTTAVQSGALVARSLLLPHLWHVHEIVERPGLIARLLRRNLRAYSSAVIAVSEAVKRWIDSDQVPVHVIPNGIGEPRQDEGQREQIRRQYLGEHEGPLIGWVGRLGSWKGHGVFLEMARRHGSRWPGAVFVLAGAAVPGLEHLETELRANLASTAGDMHIVYSGYVEDGPELVAALDVLVACPTAPDPFPRVVEEAVWHGVPVLGVRTGGIPEMVEDGENGVLVAEAEPDALAAGMETMLAPGQLQRMRRRALEIADARFGLDSFLTAIQDLLASV